MAKRVKKPEATPSALIEQRSRKAQYRLYDYRARHGEEGATVSAEEQRVWNKLNELTRDLCLAPGEQLALVEAREQAVAELEALGIAAPAKVVSL